MTPWDYAKPGCSEHASQVALFMWAKMAYQYGVIVANDPRAYASREYALKLATHSKPLSQLKWLFAIPNGGERAPAVASSMAAEGAKKGVADVMLPVPVEQPDGFGGLLPAPHGLFIEMKKEIYRTRKDGGCSQEQLDFKADMLEAGYACYTCYTWQEAVKAILSYLGVDYGTKGLSEV